MPIVVGYVPTPEGRAALASAIAEAKMRQARLVVINTSKGASLVDPRYASAADWTDVQAQLESSGVDFEVTQSVEDNDPADQIIGVAQSTNAELIVIGLRRRTAVGKLIMGSQAQTILLGAECPVLAVKAEPGH